MRHPLKYRGVPPVPAFLFYIGVNIDIHLVSLGCILKRQERLQFDHLSELGEILRCFLHLLQSVSNDILLVLALKERIAQRSLIQEKGNRHGDR